jgi:glycosyltransferase involved in cell wall biosynthesis
MPLRISSGMSKPKVTAVIPCYNVSKACVDVVVATLAHADRVIAVDDGSTDDTLEWLKTTGCEVVHLPTNKGKGVALRHGFEAAIAGQCDYVVTLDGDGQHLPEEIDNLVSAAVETGSDVVVGSRRVSHMPPQRQVGNLLTRWTFRLQTGKKLRDTQTGYRLFTPAALEKIMPGLSWGRYETEMAMLFNAEHFGLKMTTATISTVYIGDNKLTSFRNLPDSMRIFFVVLRYAAAGISSAILEFALFSAMVWLFNFHYVPALLISRAVALVNHYLVSRFFAFRMQKKIHRDEMFRYAVVAGINLAASFAFLHLLISLAGLNAVLSKAVSQTVLFWVTFFLLKQYTFRVSLRAAAAREAIRR